MIYDICIIGGGAAGMMAAITAKRINSRLNVLILERLPRVGKKLSLTGNGRCNITNRSAGQNNYHGETPSFCLSAFGRFGVSETESFFKEIGVPIIYEGDKGYPASLQATSVTDALRFCCEESGITVLCEQKVADIKKAGKDFSVTATDRTFRTHAVIAAAGMLSGGEKLGCDGNVYGILKKLGIKTVKPRPAIVQLKTDTEFVRQLKGIKVNADVTLLSKNKEKRREYGEVLFCDYGVSGPPVLQLSGDAEENDTLKLDLIPAVNRDTLLKDLLERQKNLKSRKNDEFLSGMLQKRLGQVVLKRCGVSLSEGVTALSYGDICKIRDNIKCFTLTVTGNNGFINSQVTKGGLSCKEFDSTTLMCKKTGGLFAAGELLDIDGDCGGYNLQWAWSSGYLAAASAAEYVMRNFNADT